MNDITDTFIAPPCRGDVEVLFEDKSLLLISKPSGLLSLSGKNPLNWDSVHFRLVKDYPSATLIHRLDFGTSGIMVAALNKQINGQLTKQFQQRTMGKRYKAVLHGLLAQDHGSIDLPIAKDALLFPRVKICVESGKHAVTCYQVESRDQSLNRTVVHFVPGTGRTHQLRIHSQAIGHPILGCDLYGDDMTERLADRLMLHAESLDFIHPMSGEKIHGMSPCPF